ENVIGGLDLLEALRGLFVTLIRVRVGFFDQSPVRRLNGGEVGVAVELECVERPHFVSAAASVAGPAPFPLRRLAKAGIASLLFRGTDRRLLGAAAGEVIPILVIFGGVRFAEMPALAAVGRLGRGPVADLIASFAVAQSHPSGRAALFAVGAPPRETPVVRSLLSSHAIPN